MFINKPAVKITVAVSVVIANGFFACKPKEPPKPVIDKTKEDSRPSS
jgi:hypothetical protein